jgi:hypothetical protein
MVLGIWILMFMVGLNFDKLFSISKLAGVTKFVSIHLQTIFQCQVYSLLCTFKLFMEIARVTTICTTCHHY